MVNNFGDFILEKQVVSLILENDLKASYEFLKRLRKIRDKSKVANILSQLFADEFYIVKDLSQNWIDVTSDPEMVSFLSDQRARRTPMQWDEDESAYYNASGRGTIRIGRFAQALLSDKNVIEDLEGLDLGLEDLTPRDYEEFVNLYKSEYRDMSARFEMITGKDIKKYYDLYNHAIPDKGSLGSSCMRYTDCQKYFKLYTENPEVCSLLVYLNQDDKVLGRALVWKLEKKVNDCPAEYFMDRIYTAKDSDIIRFKNYAKEQGWVMKANNTSDYQDGIIFNYMDTVILSNISVKLKNVTFNHYPFVDTLSYLSVKKGKLHNIKGKNDLELDSTNGNFNEVDDDTSRKENYLELLDEILQDFDCQLYWDLAESAKDKLLS